MAGKISKPMTPFDKSVTPSYLYKLKLFLPFLPPGTQRFLGIYIKFLEFRFTFDFFQGLPFHTFSFQSLDELTPYMDDRECSMMEQVSSMMQMMQMMETFQGTNAASSDAVSNPLDFMKQMMSGEEQSEFQNYMDLFDQELGQSKKTNTFQKGEDTHERMDESSGSGEYGSRQT